MAKGKYKKNKNQEEEDDFKKKKPMITEEHLMDKSNMDYTNFVPILLSDVMYPPYAFTTDSVKLLKKLLTDFNYLLYIDFKKFWATLLYNPSLKNCISNCLQTLSVSALNTYKFQSEQEDINVDWEYDKVRHMEAYEYLESIQKVLLFIIYRMMHYKEQDPQLSQIYNLGEAISYKYLFTIPKMFQMIAIYGQTNKKILNVIFKTYIRTVPDFYKIFIHEILPPIIKRLEQTNRQMKHLTDRQQFGISYSYKRNSQNQLSPGQEQLKRKVNHLMLCIEFIQIVKGTQFLTDQIIDNIYFNHQVHFVLQNMFYELDAAYKIWNFQEQGARLLPMMNYILYEVKEYFTEYFERANRIVVQNSMKSNTIDAYVRSLQRIFQDYGKRNSIGKKAINNRNLNLYKLVMKKFDLVTMLQKIYIEEEQNQTFQINMEYLVDFKFTLQDSIKKSICVKLDQNKQEQEEQIQEGTQTSEMQNTADLDAVNQSNGQHKKQQNQDQPESLVFGKPNDHQKLQILVPKKQREDDYYLKLYKNHDQRFKIDYEDEYDDLVDYNKRPLFMDSPSSDSQSEQQQRKHYVTNKDNQRANQQKHLNYQLKRKQSKKETKQNPNYTLVKDEQIQQLARGNQKYDSKVNNKKKYENKDDKEQKKYKEKTPNLNNFVEQQNMMELQRDEKGELINRNQPEKRDGRDHRYKPNQSKGNNGDKKRYEEKGKNSNKNREHQNGGGNQKFKYKPK